MKAMLLASSMLAMVNLAAFANDPVSFYPPRCVWAGG
jgi:hypothetical protein